MLRSTPDVFPEAEMLRSRILSVGSGLHWLMPSKGAGSTSASNTQTVKRILIAMDLFLQILRRCELVELKTPLLSILSIKQRNLFVIPRAVPRSGEPEGYCVPFHLNPFRPILPTFRHILPAGHGYLFALGPSSQYARRLKN